MPLRAVSGSLVPTYSPLCVEEDIIATKAPQRTAIAIMGAEVLGCDGLEGQHCEADTKPETLGVGLVVAGDKAGVKTVNKISDITHAIKEIEDNQKGG